MCRRSSPNSLYASPLSGTEGSSKPGETSMARVDDALLRRMTAIIVEAVDPEQVILFGFRARGNAEADSDVGLVVVEAEPFGPDRDRGAEETRLWRALAKFHVPKDILVYSVDEADRWRGSLNHVLARALREGKVLYERP